MAYSVPWDETRPPGATTPVSDLDTVIQDVQIAVRERAEQVIEDWGNDATDPKIMIEGTARVLTDVIASRPATPAFDGQLFYATDTGELQVGEAGAWEDMVNHPTGSLLDRPAGKQGDWWYVVGDTVANAENDQAYIRDEFGWKPLAPLMVYCNYNPQAAVGSKVAIAAFYKKIIMVEWRGQTTGAGDIDIDLSEIETRLSVLQGIDNDLQESEVVGVIPVAGFEAEGPSNYNMVVEDIQVVDGTIKMKAIVADTGVSVSLATFTVYIMILMK